MKLGNIARLDPNHQGSGLTSGGKLEVELWDVFGNDRAALARKVVPEFISKQLN